MKSGDAYTMRESITYASAYNMSGFSGERILVPIGARGTVLSVENISAGNRVIGKMALVKFENGVEVYLQVN